MRSNGSITGDGQAQRDLLAVLSTETGRRVYWRIITLCGVTDPIPTVNGVQQWHEGRRSIGIDLWNDAQAVNPNLIPQMMQERINEQLIKETANEQRNRGR